MKKNINVNKGKLNLLDGLKIETNKDKNKGKKPDPIFEPFYRIKINPTIAESKIMQTYWLQRLKYIHHTGIDISFSNKTYSRYQHTMGTYALACKYFPHNTMVRLAALLTGIGNTPFSDAVEDAYLNIVGHNKETLHQKLTKEIMFKTEISDILTKESMPPRAIYDINHENYSTPLHPGKNVIGLEDFDYFVKDAFYTGNLDIMPYQLVRKINFDEIGLTTDDKTAIKIHNMIIEQHKINFSDHAIIRSALAQRLFEHMLINLDLINEYPRTDNYAKKLLKQTDYEFMRHLLDKVKDNIENKKLLYELLYNNKYKIKKHVKNMELDHPDKKLIKYNIREVYTKTCYEKTVKMEGPENIDEKNVLLTDKNKKYKKEIEKLKQYLGTYYINK